MDSVAEAATRLGNGAISYTTTLDGGLVLGSAGNNNWSGPAPTITGGNVDTTLFSGANDGNHSVIHAYGLVDTAGTYTETYGSTATVAALVAFDAIPEPGTIGLLGLFGAAAFIRRRLRK